MPTSMKDTIKCSMSEVLVVFCLPPIGFGVLISQLDGVEDRLRGFLLGLILAPLERPVDIQGKRMLGNEYF